MHSRNNIFITAGDPVARYTLTPQHGITGLRLNPEEKDRKIEWSLIPLPEPAFDYERDVIELYSDKEVKFFKQANRYLFREGLIREFEGTPEPLDVSNMLTDAEVLAIASERSIKRVEARIKELTSRISVERILKTAEEVGRPAKTLAVIKARLSELS